MLEQLIKDKKGLEYICNIESRETKCCYTCQFDITEKYCALIKIKEKVCKYQGKYDNELNHYRCQK
jgi:hypothetical protein